MAGWTALVDRLYFALSIFSRGVNALGTLVVLGLVAIVNFDVVARGVFNAPFKGTFELVQFSIILIVYLQLPDVIRAGRLTRSDGFLLIVGQSRPQLTRMVRRVIDLVSAILMLLIAITMWPEVVESWETNDFFGTPGIFTAPWWPVRLVVFLSAVLCCLLWLLKALGSDPESDAPKMSDDTSETSHA
ncbi:MAG: TRAP transporter small permease [Pseudomonadota bacterium]